MEYQKVLNLLDKKQINHLNVRQKIDLKQIVTHMKHITPIAKLNLKLRC